METLITDMTYDAKPLPTLSVAGKSDRGRVRSTNEDAFVVTRLQRTRFTQQTSLSDEQARWFTGADEGWVIVVADGMGGLGGGDVASRIAVQAITDYACNVMPWLASCTGDASSRDSLPGIREHLSAALVEGDRLVRAEAARNQTAPRMGTTLTLAYVLWPRLYVAHVGDSRCYLLRNDELVRLTTDHTLAQQMMDGGAQQIDESSRLHHMLWNALGGGDVALVPEVSRVDLSLNDRLLLCTDGLPRHVAEHDIAGALRTARTPASCCQQLVEAANAAGGEDNVTTVVAWFDSSP